MRTAPAHASAAAAPAEAPTRRRLRVRDLVWPGLLSLTAIGVVIALTYEPGAFQAVRASFQPGVFLLAVLLLGVQFVVASLRLRHISRRALGFRASFRSLLTWEFLSAITPSAVGGGPFAAVFIARDQRIPLGQVSAIMLFSMLMDQIWFATAIVALYSAALWLPVFPTAFGAASIGPVALYFGAMLAWTTFFAYATLVRPELIGSLARWIAHWKVLRRFEGRVREETSKMQRQARVLRGQPVSFYAAGYAYTALVWLCRYGVVLLVALSVAPGIRWVLFYLRTAALWLVGLVMPTPGGSGGMEGLFMLFLAPLLPSGFAGPVLLGWRLLAYYTVLAVGMVVAGHVVRELLFGAPKDARPQGASAPGAPAPAEGAAAAAAPAAVTPEESATPSSAP